jgi:membrane-associated phospholipid phosphatase
MQLQPIHKKINRALWILIAILLTIDTLLLWQSGMRIEMPNALEIMWTVGGIAALCIAVNFAQPVFRQHASALDTLWLLANFNCQLAAAGVGIALLSYFTARLGLPLHDATLIAIDRFFGFNWLGYVQWVNASPLLSWMANFAYYSFSTQIFIFLILLPMYKQFTRTQHFVIIILFSGVTTVLLAALYPAIAGYIYYDIDALHEFPNIDPQGGLVHKNIMLGLHDHSLTTLSFPLYGIITFPSFHAALAVLLTYASLPFRRFRWVIIPLNIAMIFATPVAGGHYMVDVVAGVAIGFLAVYIALRILPQGKT